MNEFAMHDTAEDGDLEKVRQLIEAGVPVDSLDEQGQTPLHRAASCGQYEVATLLINSECNINLKDSVGRTPVMWAASCGRKDIVDLLLHRGAQVNCVDDRGCTLLQLASYKTGWMDIVRLILDNGEADLNAADEDGWTPLMWAVINGQEEIAALLIRAGADVNRSNVQKWTALHFAVQRDHTRLIQILLEKEGLDLNPQNIKGQTPLHLACLFHCHEAIKQLLDAGANVNVKDYSDSTALGIWLRRWKSPPEEEIKLFIQKGAFLDNCDYEYHISNFFSVKTNAFLKDVELCTQSVVNKFHHQSLPALNSIAYFARRLPNVDNFKLKAQHIDEVRNLVKCEIERNNICNVVKIRPISLSALCVLSLITCGSIKKRAASPDFSNSPFKKIHN